MNKVAVISGGGSGMGAAAARKLAAEGYKVAILSPSGRGAALAEELGGLGVTGSNQSADDLARLVDETMSKWGRIDALVNSAGHGPRGDIAALTDAEWHSGMDVYLLSAIRPTRLVTPIMAAQGGGAIINISSYVAFEPSADFPMSSVFRAGLAAWARLHADAHAAQGVRINNILPGFIDSFPVQDRFLGKIPAARYGKVEEIAATVAFLASEGAAYITGENIRVDGGITRGL